MDTNDKLINHLLDTYTTQEKQLEQTRLELEISKKDYAEQKIYIDDLKTKNQELEKRIEELEKELSSFIPCNDVMTEKEIAELKEKGEVSQNTLNQSLDLVNEWVDKCVKLQQELESKNGDNSSLKSDLLELWNEYQKNPNKNAFCDTYEMILKKFNIIPD